MSRQVALIRGINVGGKMVSMGRLREVMEAAGYEGVRTHLQSGNVLFKAREKHVDDCAGEIGQLILEHFGHSVPVIIRDEDELRRIVDQNPLQGVANDPARHLVAFLSAPPDRYRVSELDPAEFLPDRFAVGEREVHLWYPNGVHESRLSHALFEKRLSVTATARNWNTVTKVLSLMAQRP